MLACLTDPTLAVNVAPFANAAISRPTTNNRFSLLIDGTSSCDLNGDELTYAWSILSGPPGSGFELDDAAASTVSMTVDTEGEYLVELVVHDGELSSAPFQFPVFFDDTPGDGGPYFIVAGQDLQLFGHTTVAVPGGEVSWTIGSSRFFDNDRLVTWTELEEALGPSPAGIFAVNSEVFIGSGAFTFHETTLTILRVNAPTTSNFPSGSAVFGDIDGDGDLDAVGQVGNQSGSQLSAFLNQGDGTFAIQDVNPGVSLQESIPEALVDIDDDGDLDLIVTPETAPTTLLLNEGGVFGSPEQFANANTTFGAVEATDVEADGDVDVFVSDEMGIRLYLNSGGALSFDRTLFAGNQIHDTIFADFDGNGLLDVLLERTDGEKELWWNEAGSFTESAMPMDNLPSLTTLHSRGGDLDGDGDVDLIGANSIYLQDGSGAFFDASAAALGALDQVHEIYELADFNDDGHVDLLARLTDPSVAPITPGQPLLHILLNDGLATFSTAITINSSSDFTLDDVFVQDFNADGQVDFLAGAAPGGTDGLIWFNQITPGSWHNSDFGPDVDNNGVVTPLDPLLIINELNDRQFSDVSGQLPVAPWDAPFLDINHDGFVSPVDAILAINELAGLGPIFSPPPDVSIVPGYPLMIPLDGLLSSGADISYTVSSDRPGLVSGIIPDGNRSLRMSVSSPGNNIEGEMVFQLFENYVPRITERVIELAESGFYDGLTFHDINSVSIGGGDPNGDGSGGSELADVDDQYHPDMRHSQTGTLTMYRPFADANNSQFMIMNNRRHTFDFDFSVFGMLVEGEGTRKAISEVPAAPNGQPTSQVTITDVEVMDDHQNRVLILRTPLDRDHGTAVITVTATSGERSESRTFEVVVTPNGFRFRPYLEDIPTINTAVDTEVTYQLVGIDVDTFTSINYLSPEQIAPIAGDFPAQLPPGDVLVTVDSDTGLLRISPTNGYVGTFQITVGLGLDFSTTFIDDLQTITVVVG